jgi:hypothetical protein
MVGACSLALLVTPQLQAQNTVVGAGSGVGGGVLNLIGYANYAWIGGGVTNMIFSDFGMVGAGYSNVVGGSAPFSTIGGGYGNAVAAGSTVSVNNSGGPVLATAPSISVWRAA